ncbi:MAG: DUF374 domain-containing protein [Polyangiaceae bacterium]
MRALRHLAGNLIGAVASVWLRTLRVEVRGDGLAHVDGARPWVMAFFHGTQWPLLAWKRRRPTSVLVSHSEDGDLQSRALSVLGLRVVRGSSSKGGAKGLVALVRRLRRHAEDEDLEFAVDGPRGPYGTVHEGALVAALRTGATVVPLGAHVPHGLTLRRTWDRFRIAWPFTRVVVVVGAPLEPVLVTPSVLARAIEDANTAAERTAAEGHGAEGELAFEYDVPDVGVGVR